MEAIITKETIVACMLVIMAICAILHVNRRCKSKPLYEHDCEHCLFLGNINDMDAYACEDAHGTSYILRRSSTQSSYGSFEDTRNIKYDALRVRREYSDSFTKDEIHIDILRRVLFIIHSGTIAASMDGR